MKNTKHTEMNDSSIEQDNQENLSQSKRKILTSIGVTSGVVGASALVPSTWVKPAVNSVILPAHAQQTPPMNGTTLTPTTTPMGMGPTTMMPTTMMPTTMMPTTMMPTTMMPTTMMPTTTEAPMTGAMIVAVRGQAEDTIGDGNTLDYYVSLSEQPLNDVMVMVTISPAVSGTFFDTAGEGYSIINPLTFMRANYKTEQKVGVAIIEAAPEDPAMTVKFVASGGGYDKVETSDMVTIVNDENEVPTGLKATAGKGMVEVEWTAPDTNTMPARYIVQLDAGGNAPEAVLVATADSSVHPNYIKNVSSGLSYTFMNLPAGVMYSCMVVAVYAKDDAGSSGRFRPAAAGATTSKVVG